MQPYFSDDTVTLYAGDCLDALPTLPDASVDAVVCDPPYGLTELSTTKVLQAIAAWMAGDRTHVPNGRGFMGRDWDQFVPPPGVWDECMRVLKPGGHLLAFSGARTVDLMTLSIRIAGFEIRESINWIYASGFPKSLDVSKAIDKRPGVKRHPEFAAELKAARLAKGFTNSFDVAEHVIGRRTGAVANWEKYQFPEAKWWPALRDLLDLDDKWGPVIAEADREVIGQRTTGIGTGRGSVAVIGDGENRDVTAPATDDARRWSGFGTALKPAHEPIVCARKPLSGTVAATVLEHGTGALNIDACRTSWDPKSLAKDFARRQQPRSDITGGRLIGGDSGGYEGASASPTGRWPTNVVLTHSAACADECAPDCPVAEMDRQSGVRTSGSRKAGTYGLMGYMGADAAPMPAIEGDSGGASRYFPVFRYTAHDQVFFPVECPTCGGALIKDANTSAGKKTENSGGNSRTDGSGNRPTDQSPRATRSTTETTTPSTTTCPTSCASPQSGTTTTTSDSARNTDGSAGPNSESASGAPSGSRSANTTSAGKERGRDIASLASAPIDESGFRVTARRSTRHVERSADSVSIRNLPVFRYEAKAPASERPRGADGTAHATVKPLKLMQWLVRLVTPPRVLVCELCENRRYESSTKTAGSVPPLPEMRDGVQAPGQQSSAALLLEGVREPSNADHGSRETLREVLGAVHADKDGQAGRTLLLEEVQHLSERAEPGELQGIDSERKGIHPGPSSGTPNGEPQRLRSGAQTPRCGSTGEDAGSGRSGSSHQRSQGRQSPGESGSARQAGARQSSEAPEEADSVPALRGNDRDLGSCEVCGSALVERPGTVLDPFLGSGTTAEACVIEGFRCIGIERDETHLPLIKARLAKPIQPALGFEDAS